MNLKLYYNSEHCSNFLQLLYSFLYFFVQSFYTELVLAKKLVLDLPCGNTNLSDSEGIINSPNYPFVYPYEISCEWKIYSPEKSVIKLNLVDMDMQEDLFCSEPPCCSNQWLLLPKEQENGSELLLCGNNFISKTMFLSSQVTSIKYFSSGLMINKRGFKITYKIKSRDCKINEVECLYSHQCILAEKLCNGIDDCRDGSDEFNCSWKSYSSKHEFLPRKILDVNHHALDICGSGKRPCDLSPDHCYSPMDSCDDEFDCPNGEDEVGCSKLNIKNFLTSTAV